jgi:hypothetical protein
MVALLAQRYDLSRTAALGFSRGCSRTTQAHHTAGETTSSTWTPAPAALKTEDDAPDPAVNCRSLRVPVKSR